MFAFLIGENYKEIYKYASIHEGLRANNMLLLAINYFFCKVIYSVLRIEIYFYIKICRFSSYSPESFVTEPLFMLDG